MHCIVKILAQVYVRQVKILFLLYDTVNPNLFHFAINGSRP